MYTPSFFEVDDPELIRTFIEENNFGLIVSSKDGSSIQETLTPFLFSSDENIVLGHIARANPHWKEWNENKRVKIIFQGPHCYISPNYYQSSINVPTWNYTAVSMEGEIVEDLSEQKAFMHWLVDKHEQSLPHPWRFDEANEQFLKLFDAVVFFKVRITKTTAKFKLNQNKADPIDLPWLTNSQRAIHPLKEKLRP
ncbi:MAG: FMN-binding negative transcriptional regulator [Opitutales bacterium]|jgi:transcriptional regulator|nr:FMN-binding negative transcriptional regulator [Opitutales bacterium]